MVNSVPGCFWSRNNMEDWRRPVDTLLKRLQLVTAVGLGRTDLSIRFPCSNLAQPLTNANCVYLTEELLVIPWKVSREKRNFHRHRKIFCLHPSYSISITLAQELGQQMHLTLRLLMSFICGASILDVSRSHTTTHHSR
jgi:hypothetical protein